MPGVLLAAWMMVCSSASVCPTSARSAPEVAEAEAFAVFAASASLAEPVCPVEVGVTGLGVSTPRIGSGIVASPTQGRVGAILLPNDRVGKDRAPGGGKLVECDAGRGHSFHVVPGITLEDCGQNVLIHACQAFTQRARRGTRQTQEELDDAASGAQ